MIVIGVSLLLYAWRAPRLGGGGSFSFVSRETALLGNNVLLSVASASVTEIDFAWNRSWCCPSSGCRTRARGRSVCSTARSK